MTEIIQKLLLASYSQAKEMLSAYPINNVYTVNCTKNLDMITKNGIRLPVNDDLSEKSLNIMYTHFDSVIQYIDNLLKRNKIVIVHCQAGQQLYVHI
jgi:rhodanese-related sulfurtransferase